MRTSIFKTTLLLIAFLITSCSNNDDPTGQDQLPPITQTGANTFGCVINGEVLIPKDKTGYTPPGGGTPKGLEVYYKSNNNFIINAANLADEGGGYIYIYNLTSIGDYSLGLSEGLSDFHFEPNYPHSWCGISNQNTSGKKYISTSNSGVVNITKFDTNNNIVSGVFNNLTMVNINDENDVIQIKDGRFDFNLTTVNN